MTLLDPRTLTGRSDTVAALVASTIGEGAHVRAIKIAAVGNSADLAGATVYAPNANARGKLVMAATDLGWHLVFRWDSFAAGGVIDTPVRVKVTGRGWYNGGLEVPSLKISMTYIDPMDFGNTPSGYRETAGVPGWIL